MFIVAMGIFMGVKSPATNVYGYSYGITWAAVPFAIIAGVIMFFLREDVICYWIN